MSEALPEGGNTGEKTPATEEFTAINSQEELNKVLNERLTRERAKFADYKDLKAKATKLDEIEQANQTEVEKAAKRIAELEADLTSTRHDSARIKIASEHGITDADDIELFLTGTDEETLTKQAKRLADREADRKKNGNRVPREGHTTPKPGDDPMREFARDLFKPGD